MIAKIISTLPGPYRTFETLCKYYAFLRIHGSYTEQGEKKYTYQLFSFVPAGGLYSQRTIQNVNVEKIMSYLGINNDFIKACNQAEGLGSIYLQVETNQLYKLLD
jgi:hypothetical protein